MISILLHLSMSSLVVKELSNPRRYADKETLKGRSKIPDVKHECIDTVKHC